MKAWIEIIKWSHDEYSVLFSVSGNRAVVGRGESHEESVIIANRWAVRLGGVNPDTGKVEPLKVRDLTGGE